MLPRGPRRGQANFRSHNSCLSLGASSPGRRRAYVLFGVSFRGGYSPTGLPGDTAWLAFRPTGWGRLGVLSQRGGHCRGRSPPAHSLDSGRQVHRWRDDQEGAEDEEGLYRGGGGRQRGRGPRGGAGHQKGGESQDEGGGQEQSSCHLFGGGERWTLCPAALAAPRPRWPSSKRRLSVQLPAKHSCLQYVQQQNASHSHQHDNLERVRQRAKSTAQ